MVQKALITIFAFNYGCPTICATDQRQVTKNSGHPLVVDQEAYTSLWTTNANRIFGMCDSSTLVLSYHLAEEFECPPFVVCLSLFMTVSNRNPKMCGSTRMFTYCFFFYRIGFTPNICFQFCGGASCFFVFCYTYLF